MRRQQHVIDTKAVKQVLNSIPDHWVVRELTERDYGIDLMVEIFEQTGFDKHKHEIYGPTGHIVYLQIKGTNEKIKVNSNQTISLSIEKKFLFYAEKFSTPFLLVRVSTAKKNSTIYFLWTQRYILEVLDRNSSWRTAKGESITVKIPSKNKLQKNAKKIEDKIAPRIKYIEEHAEFYEKYTLFKESLPFMIKGKLAKRGFKTIISDLERIKNLRTLLQNNSCQVDENDIEDLISYIKGIQGGQIKPNSLTDFPDPLMFNLELLEGDNFMRMIGEKMEAENERDTTY